jgi:hypothetical protein
MSYCRWSTDNWKCDLYIYESVGDFWALHVAANRNVYTEDGNVDHDNHIPIDLPHAGEMFELATPGDCADKCEELRKLGYNFPDYVITTLREEQAELDNGECK